MVVVLFFFLKNPTNYSICLQRKCRLWQMLVVAVGRLLRQPQQQCKDAVFPVYISISIYIYIYMLSLPSLSLVTVRCSWDIGVGVGESRLKAPS